MENSASPLIWHQKRKLKKSAKKFQQRVAITIILLTVLLIVGCLLSMFMMIQISSTDFNFKNSYYENANRR